MPSLLSHCFRRAKIQNLSAIHNTRGRRSVSLYIVSDVQRYKICQQFTTKLFCFWNILILFQTCKDTKFVSNSQPRISSKISALHCFRRAKIQNLSAIHNNYMSVVLFGQLFQTCKDTKFVSNSQQKRRTSYSCSYCFRRAKIQNLSAIHNRYKVRQLFWNIVSDVQRYKICQQFTTVFPGCSSQSVLFQTCKDTKFVSNSQHLS